MALSLKRLGKRFLEEINPFDGKGGLDFNKPVKRQSVSQSAPLLKPQVQQRQFNQPRNIFQAPVDRPQFKQPQYQAPTDPIRAKQAQQVQELTDRFRAGQITDEQRQTATQAVLGTQPKAVVKLKGVKGGVESVKDRSLFDAQQQEGYRQAIKPVTSRLQKTQDWVNSSDKKAGFQWDSAGDYGRFAANLIPGMAQGLIEAPIKTGQGVSGERVKNGKVEKMNLVQRGGALADSVISTAGLGIGGSATLLKGAAGGLVKTGLKETARKILKDAGVEGTEELVQAFANDLSDDGTINTDPKAYAQAFALGALGGGMMSGAGKGTQAVRNNLKTNIPKIAKDNRGIVAGPLAGDFSIDSNSELGGNKKTTTIRIYDTKRNETTQEIASKPVQITDGVNTVIHREVKYGKDWVVSESTTGMSIATGKTQAEAKANALKTIQKHPEIQDVIAKQQERFGVKPTESRPTKAPVESKTPQVGKTGKVGGELDALKAEARKYKSADDYQLTTGDKAIDPKIKQIVEMSPDEYLRQAFEATDGRLGGDYDSWLASNAQDALVAKQYAEAMLKGDKFPLAYIDKAMGSQDGRNRAIAAKLAGRDKMPVGIVPEMTKAEKISWLESKVKQYPEKSYLGNKYRRELTDIYNQAQPSKPVAPVESKPTVTKKPTLQDALDGKSTKKVVESAVKPVVTAKTTKPKVALKEASSKKPKVELKEPKSIDEILYEDTPQFEERDKSLGQTLSPDRYIRENITQPLEQAINTGISKIPGVRRLAQGVSREAGVSPELLQQKRLLRGGVEKGKLVRESISELGDGLTIEQKTKAWATLDPEQASKVGIEQPTKLTARETQYRDKLAQIQTEITSGNLSRDLINEQQAANPSYIKRGYSVFEENSDASKAYNQTRQSLLKQFKGRKDVNEDLIDSAITDPGYLVAKKAAESQAAWAMVDYGNYLVESGLASDTKQSGMRQLPNSKIYGEAAGKYVPTNVSEDFTGFQYNNGVINAYNDLITAYDNLGIRKAKKELLTVFNPAVRVGNQFSNRVVFANMNGINPIQFEQNYLEAGKQISEKGQLYREAIEQGLTGIDVTQADFAERIAQYADDPNMAIRAIEWTKKSYSAADDKARIAAYITHRKRGYSPEEAASLTQRGFQDYKSVGFFYDMAAKTPFIGNAFVRFAGDAIRIAKNAAVDHPLRSVATIALWSTFTGAMSRLSGESEEDKKTREQRFGAPSIPFTDISMTVQTPFGEVNVARFLPFYQLNDIQNPLARFSPIQANPLKPEGWQDPLLGQVGQLIADKDFRGKSIKDPENTGQFNDELPKDQQLKNQARFVATQNVPLGREADALISASQGKPDIYGKTRSVPQALGRAGGVKIEQFGPKEAEKTRQTNAYFKEKERIDKEIAGLPKKEQEAYKRLTGYSKLREQVDNEFDPGTKRYKKAPVYDFPEDKWKDYSPGLYDKIKKFKERENKKQGTPIQPEFDERLSKEFRKQLINNKSLAPGEDVEADARMYSSSEWDTYEQIKQEYKDAASKYYPDDGKDDFVDELVKHKSAPFPVKGPAKKAYDDAYKLYNKGKGPKPAYNDQVDAEKEAYNNAKLDWTNVERKARGLGPISKEVWDNVTFGFSSDEEKVYKQLKYGKGYGGGKGGRGRGGGKGSQGVGSAYKYAIDLNAGGAVAKPKVKVAKAGPAPVSKKSGGKPKVSLKKSKV